MCVKETSCPEVSFTHIKHIFDMKKSDNNHFGAYILLSPPSYYSNFGRFKIKSLIPRNLNLHDSTVYQS